MFFGLFKNKKAKDSLLNSNTHVYSVGGTWGNKIEWFDFERRRIVGWKSILPRQNDLLLSNMKSGKTAIFKIGVVENCNDPRDMFFAYVEFIGYLEDHPEKERILNAKKFKMSGFFI